MSADQQATNVETYNRINVAFLYLNHVRARTEPAAAFLDGSEQAGPTALIPREEEVLHVALDAIEDFITGRAAVLNRQASIVNPQSPIPNPQLVQATDGSVPPTT